MEDMEAELIKRNREIAHARDSVSKLEGRVQEVTMRNNDLLETLSHSDSELNAKKTQVEVFEAEVKVLKGTVEEQTSQLATIKQDHDIKTDSLQKELQEMKAMVAKSETQEDSRGKIAEIEEARAQLVSELENARKMHAATKALLEQAESSSFTRVNAAILKQKEAEDRIVEVVADNARLVARLNEHQSQVAQASTESRGIESSNAKVQRDLDELRLINKDLEEQMRENEKELDMQRIELDQARHELKTDSSTKAALEKSRNEAEAEVRRLQVESPEAMKEKLQSTQAELFKQQRRADDAEGRYNAQREFHEGTETELADAEQRIMQLERDCEDLRQLQLKATLEGAKDAADRESQVKEKSQEIERKKIQIETLQQKLDVEVKARDTAEQRAEMNLTQSDALTNAKDKIRLLEGQVALRQQEKERVERERDTLETSVATLRKHKDTLEESLASEQDAAQKRVMEVEARVERDRESHRKILEETRRTNADEGKQFQVRLVQNEAELNTARMRCDLLSRNKADLLTEVSDHNSKVANVENSLVTQRAESRRLGSEVEEVKQAKAKVESELAALRQEGELEKTIRSARINGDALKQVSEHRERMCMAAEENLTYKNNFNLEKKRLEGALSESRRSVMNMMISAGGSSAANDGGQMTQMEQALSEERKKSMEQSVMMSRLQRDNARLESTNARVEDYRSKAVDEARRHEAEAREKERECAKKTEELRRATIKVENARERTAMSSAEIEIVKYNAQKEVARAKGQCAELQYMATNRFRSTGAFPSMAPPTARQTAAPPTAGSMAYPSMAGTPEHAPPTALRPPTAGSMAHLLGQSIMTGIPEHASPAAQTVAPPTAGTMTFPTMRNMAAYPSMA